VGLLIVTTTEKLLAAINTIVDEGNKYTRQQLKEYIRMSTQETVDAVTAKLDKVYTEVTSAREILLAEIARLQGDQVDTTALEAAADKLDDINEDAPEPQPEPAPVVEEPAEPVTE
jgi:3-oxoacyl-[acyl-carrier-protein] synthase III